MTERRSVEIAELGNRELGRCERKAEVGVGELRAQPLAAGKDDRAVVEGQFGRVVDGLPIRVTRQFRIEVARYEAEICGCELPLLRRPLGIAERLELLEMRELAHVDFRRKMTANRLFERLAGTEIAAGEGPGAPERIARPLPEKNLQLTSSDLEDDGQRDMGGVRAANLARGFSPHSRKP